MSSFLLRFSWLMYSLKLSFFASFNFASFSVQLAFSLKILFARFWIYITGLKVILFLNNLVVSVHSSGHFVFKIFVMFSLLLCRYSSGSKLYCVFACFLLFIFFAISGLWFDSWLWIVLISHILFEVIK